MSAAPSWRQGVCLRLSAGGSWPVAARDARSGGSGECKHSCVNEARARFCSRPQEDLILPHHHTFYELIINKARGKSGPLFDFG